MRTVLTVDYEAKIIQKVKVQTFNRNNSLSKITEPEAKKLLQIPGRFDRYTRKYQTRK